MFVKGIWWHHKRYISLDEILIILYEGERLGYDLNAVIKELTVLREKDNNNE